MSSPIERLRAEAESNGAASLKVPGGSVAVPPAGTWPAPAMSALRHGDYDSWADWVLSDADYEAWIDADLTVDECTRIFEKWGERTGEDLGRVFSLHAFLEEHCEAVEKDLPRVYPGRSLQELFRGDMSYRELWVLIDGLPQDSWTQTALRDDPNREHLPERAGDGEERFGPWSLVNFQLAILTDAVRQLEFVLARVNGNKDYPQPEPTPRPGMKRLARQMFDDAEVEAARRYLNEFNRGKG